MNFRRIGGLVLAGVVVAVGAYWGSRWYQSAATQSTAKTSKGGGTTNSALTNAAGAGRPVPRPGSAAPPAIRPNPAVASAKAPAPGPVRPATAGKGAGTNAVAGKAPAGTSSGGLVGWYRQYQGKPWFYPALAAIPLGLGALFVWLMFQSKEKKGGAAAATEAPRAGVKPLRRKGGAAAIHSCNVLDAGAGERQVWQFGARGGGFVQSRSQTVMPGESLPSGMVAKDWRSLFQQKLNIAWLPPEQVFLRVAQFPISDFDETLSMIELQLEKLSPMPVTQIVWGVHVLPHAKGDMQTVILMIAARNVVEDFLGRLEGEGYLADRLELPIVDQIQATPIPEDGAWIYPVTTGNTSSALVAWWYGGVLRNLDLLALPAVNRTGSVKEQLTQMAWAGEMEGWLSAPPRWHLVAEGGVAGEWEPALREGLEQTVEVSAPLAPGELAALTAARSAHSEPRANLLPVEFSTRYQAQFVDGLWMGALGAVVGLYIVGVAVYLIALQFVLMQVRGVESQVVENGPAYTNALQLKAQFQVLQERQDLKYAALDAWKAVAELLPSDVTLDGFNFSDGKKLTLNGTAPSDQGQALLQFDAAMRKYSLNGQALFDPLNGDHMSSRANPGGATVTWQCSYELKRVEMQ